jgi:hypothetical protein
MEERHLVLHCERHRSISLLPFLREYMEITRTATITARTPVTEHTLIKVTELGDTRPISAELGK